MKVVFVVGSTASGKSQLALKLAREFGGAIVNADSVQLYEGLTIGSAAPTEEEKKLAPHFLYQNVKAPDRWTVGDYHREAHSTFAALSSKFQVVFVVGGTGFYVQALTRGLWPVEASDPEVRSRIELELASAGEQVLHHELEAADPETAARISPQDHYRLVRALEIWRSRGRRPSDIRAEHNNSLSEFPYPRLMLGVQVEREALWSRIEARTDQMLAADLIGEVRDLLERGLGEWEPLGSVGYRETCQHLRREPGFETRELLREQIVLHTRQLAKKQRTWFQRDSEIQWVSPEDHAKAKSLVEEFLLKGEGDGGS